MLLRHGAQYMIARGLPGVFNFLAIAIYTRLVSSDEYGAYTLTIAAVGAADALLFQWMRLALLRFLPSEASNRRVALATVIRLFLGVALGVVALIFMGMLLVGGDLPSRGLLGLGAGVFLVQGLFELTVERERSMLSPFRYGLNVGAKSIGGLLVGAGLAAAGLGAVGLLIGQVVAMLIPLVAFGGISLWISVLRDRYDPALARAFLRYGLPLAATAALGFVTSSSDRFMLAAYFNQAMAGRYAVGYDLAQFTLGMLLSVVNLAAYPLVVAALEKHGRVAAQQHLRLVLQLLLAVGVPATAGIGILSNNLAVVMVGAEFRETTATVVPWIAASALVAGLKAFYFDLAFQLGRSTITQLWIVLVTAAANVALNAWMIPRIGILGAVYATLAAYCVALLLSLVLGRRVFPVPLATRTALPIIFATALMVAALVPLRTWLGPAALLVQIAVGVVVYGTTLLLIDRNFLSNLAKLESPEPDQQVAVDMD